MLRLTSTFMCQFRRGFQPCASTCAMSLRANLDARVGVLSQQNALYSATKKEDLKLPKRPVSPFALFHAENFASIRRSAPAAKVSDIMRLAAQKWKGMSEGDKKVYAEKFMKRREVYKQEMDLLDPKEVKKANLVKMIAKQERAGRRVMLSKKREYAEKFDRPKQPSATGFGLFMRELRSRKEMGGGVEGTKTAKAKWDKLTPEAKKMYNDAHKAKMAEYKTKLEAWEATMKKRSLGDVVDAFHQRAPHRFLAEGRAARLVAHKRSLRRVLATKAKKPRVGKKRAAAKKAKAKKPVAKRSGAKKVAKSGGKVHSGA